MSPTPGPRLTARAICEQAAGLVAGDREATHGDKVQNHANIARLWNGYLWNIDQSFPGVSAGDVANLMELLKVARRQAGAWNPDDYVDGAGYAAVAGEIAARELAAVGAELAAAGGVPPIGEHRFADVDGDD